MAATKSPSGAALFTLLLSCCCGSKQVQTHAVRGSEAAAAALTAASWKSQTLTHIPVGHVESVAKLSCMPVQIRAVFILGNYLMQLRHRYVNL